LSSLKSTILALFGIALACREQLSNALTLWVIPWSFLFLHESIFFYPPPGRIAVEDVKVFCLFVTQISDALGIHLNTAGSGLGFLR
jgi:hypothetical protein